jgi:hypothetical protein
VSEEKRMYEEIKNLASSKGLDIVGDNFDPNMHDIERAVDEINPDLLIVDGMYLIKNKGIDRHSIISNTAFDFKRMAMTRGIPIIASHQFNRTVSAEDRLNIDISNVAVSDVIGWTADVAYGMYQTTEMKVDNVMGWRPMKLREGVSDDHFTNWNFKKMFFDQRDRPQVAPRGAENLEYNSIPVDTEWAGSDSGNDQLF